MQSGSACWIWSKRGCSWETSRRPVATAAAGRVCRKRGSALGDHADGGRATSFFDDTLALDRCVPHAGRRYPAASPIPSIVDRVQDAMSRFSCQTPIRKLRPMSPSIDACIRYHRRRSTMTKTQRQITGLHARSRAVGQRGGAPGIYVSSVPDGHGCPR